jgi:hypothetical protein
LSGHRPSSEAEISSRLFCPLADRPRGPIIILLVWLSLAFEVLLDVVGI